MEAQSLPGGAALEVGIVLADREPADRRQLLLQALAVLEKRDVGRAAAANEFLAGFEDGTLEARQEADGRVTVHLTAKGHEMADAMIREDGMSREGKRSSRRGKFLADVNVIARHIEPSAFAEQPWSTSMADARQSARRAAQTLIRKHPSEAQNIMRAHWSRHLKAHLKQRLSDLQERLLALDGTEDDFQ